MWFKKKRLVVGLIETITLENSKKIKAKIDSGADSSSIDESIAKKLNKKVLSHKTVKSALGKDRRPIIRLKIELEGKMFSEKFTISDRSNLKYKVLIGKDILKKEGLMIDPLK